MRHATTKHWTDYNFAFYFFFLWKFSVLFERMTKVGRMWHCDNQAIHNENVSMFEQLCRTPQILARSKSFPDTFLLFISITLPRTRFLPSVACGNKRKPNWVFRLKSMMKFGLRNFCLSNSPPGITKARTHTFSMVIWIRQTPFRSPIWRWTWRRQHQAPICYWPDYIWNPLIKKFMRVVCASACVYELRTPERENRHNKVYSFGRMSESIKSLINYKNCSILLLLELFHCFLSFLLILSRSVFTIVHRQS